MAALAAAITDDTACVLIQSPNFFGTIEDVAAIADLAHSKGALLIVSIAEAISLGIVAPPKEADIVSLEAQSYRRRALATAVPYCGVIACKEKFLRQMPGRLIGETKDVNGKRGFVLTLSTREQHIRREKATSNICTNQALVALMTTIFLTIYGKEGMRELAEHNLAKADYLRTVLAPKGKVLFDGAPRFHEFVLETPASATEKPPTTGLLERENHRRPRRSEHFYPELGPGASLWCATEVTRREGHGPRRAGNHRQVNTRSRATAGLLAWTYQLPSSAPN